MPAKGTKNNKARMWFPAEVARLEMLYPTAHNTDLAKLFGRSYESIKKKARKLGLEKDYAGGYRLPRPTPENAWTEEEVKELKHRYPKVTIEELVFSLGRTSSAIKTKVKKLGLRKTERWKEDEVAFLTKYYPTKGSLFVANKLGRTRLAIQQKAQKLGTEEGICSKKSWAKKEDRILNELFFDLSAEQVGKRLGRTARSVKARAVKLGLVKQPRWTDEETEQLKSLFPTHTREEIAEIMGLSFGAISGKIKRMGLRKNKRRKKKTVRLQQLSRSSKGKKSA